MIDTFDGSGTFCLWLIAKFNLTLRIGGDRLWSVFFFYLHFDFQEVGTNVTELLMLKTTSQHRQWAAWAPALGLGLTGPWGITNL